MQILAQQKKAVDAGQLPMPAYQMEYELGVYSILNGNHQEAITHLPQTYEAGNKEYYWWKKFNPFFQELESYPGYQNLMKEMKADIERMRENYLQLPSQRKN